MTARKHGKHTGGFGLWLVKYLQRLGPEQYFVVYDHGDPDQDPHVAAVQGFYGDQVSNQNRLADIDILVANQDREALLLMEIEESEMVPKKMLGDLFAILMCSRVAVKVKEDRHDFTLTPDTHRIIAGILPTKGAREKKVRQVIQPRLQEFSQPKNSLPLEKVNILSENHLQEMIHNLKYHAVNLLDSAPPLPGS
jgi:hypothetical protein